MSVRVLGDIVAPNEVISNSIVHVNDDGLIEAITPSDSKPVEYDYSGFLIVPGFIDLHVHGGGGADFMDGTEDAVRTVLRTHAKFGTTTLLATTLTASRGDIDLALSAIAHVMRSPSESEARIAGVHLEGPYICAAKRGAQPLAPIRPPDIEELAHWIELSDGAIKLITMAPETATDGGQEFVKYARSKGIIVSIGHTNATYDQAESAIGFGISHATHLFNAMPPLHHREPGPVGACLGSDEVYVELIADGVHVHPAVVKMATKAKPTDKIILITDAISGASMPDGNYTLGGQDAIVANGMAKFRDGTLAGSVLTMNHAFLNIQKFAEVSIVEASRMSSLNAANELGIQSWTGSIEVGKRADIAVLNSTSSDVIATMRDGVWIYRA